MLSATSSSRFTVAVRDAFQSMALIACMKAVTEHLPWNLRHIWWQEIYGTLDDLESGGSIRRWIDFLNWILEFVHDTYVPLIEHSDTISVFRQVHELSQKITSSRRQWGALSDRCQIASLCAEVDLSDLLRHSNDLRPDTEEFMLREESVTTIELQCMVGMVANAIAELHCHLLERFTQVQKIHEEDLKELEKLAQRVVEQLFQGFFKLNELLECKYLVCKTGKPNQRLALEIATKLLKCLRGTH